jgi:DNA-binding transcriptional LysR family regulator
LGAEEIVVDVLELKTFCAILEEGTVRAAATALHLSQPAVSARIAKLEAELGYELFVRHGRTVALSKHGKELTPYARKLLALMQEANHHLQAFNDKQRLVLNIASSSRVATYLLPSLLQKFKRKYPSIAVTMHTTSEPLVMLDSTSVDVALGSAANSKGVRYKKLFLASDVLIAVCSPAFASSNAYKPSRALTLGDIAGNVINFTRDRAFYRPLWKLLRQTKGYGQQSILVDNIEAMKRMAISDIGIAFLPRAAVRQELAEGGLVEVPLRQGKLLPRDTFLIYRAKRYMNPAIEHFVAAAEDWRKEMQTTGM